MPKNRKSRFDALADRTRALERRDVESLQPMLKYATGILWSAYDENTLGRYADELKLMPYQLLEILERWGISGLTESHKIDKSTIRRFEEYLRNGKAKSKGRLYLNDREIDSKVVVVESITGHLLQQLARSPDLLYKLDPRRFEELVARMLEDQGCDVTLTKRTRDGGYDILARMRSGPADLLLLVECKKYAPQNKVGVEVIRGLFGVTETRRANLGLVITTSSFTKDAINEKIRIGPRIDLKEYEDLCLWLRRYDNGA